MRKAILCLASIIVMMVGLALLPLVPGSAVEAVRLVISVLVLVWEIGILVALMIYFVCTARGWLS